MEITLNVPDELASQIQPVEDLLPKILELGIRTWKERDGASFSGFADVLEKLASLPSPEEILALRPTPALEERLEELVEKSHSGGWSPEEEREWRQYEYVEHLVRMAKARAALLQGQ
jgi:hypothetical protein